MRGSKNLFTNPKIVFLIYLPKYDLLNNKTISKNLMYSGATIRCSENFQKKIIISLFKTLKNNLTNFAKNDLKNHLS
ncbi:hypothetical protein BpHYR1_051078 [Brachionus plicatilis]|uniref:Uncharacterized protein n=1 Tax=Brachionus plicatilis TaxID=10195 RepID=A0A3M7QVU7_BRAPC|nr:hypothetical protein BpHYR1_051078 [Brachionus plicatilis]